MESNSPRDLMWVIERYDENSGRYESSETDSRDFFYDRMGDLTGELAAAVRLVAVGLRGTPGPHRSLKSERGGPMPLSEIVRKPLAPDRRATVTA